jgi:hypothetical protein
VSNPLYPVRVGGFETNVLGVEQLTLGKQTVPGKHVFLLNGRGFHMIDVSNPTNPVRVGGCDPLPVLGQESYVHSMAVSGNYAYAIIGWSGFDSWDYRLDVIDVSNPTNCVRVGGGDFILQTYLDLRPNDVAVVGHYAYLMVGDLYVIDVANPTNCVLVGGDTGSIYYLTSMAVSGNYAYVVEAGADVHVIDVSNPTNFVRLGSYRTHGTASGVAVEAGRIFVADGAAGLLVHSSLPNVQFTVRVDEGALGTPYTIEAATNLTGPNAWTSLWTTNPPALPFDFVDYDVRLSEKPHKFYRVRQP